MFAISRPMDIRVPEIVYKIRKSEIKNKWAILPFMGFQLCPICECLSMCM